MKILHTFCLNYNIGDYALGIGLKNILRNYLSVDLIGNTNIQGREFNEYYIKEVVNKKYDVLVIGGGGIIHGAHWPNGWFWLIDKDLIQEIKIPFMVYGVGYNYWEEEGGIPQKGIDHLKETIKYARYFSVRNDGSADRIYKQTGIQSEVVPDPGFQVKLNTSYPKYTGEPFVIIQLADDKPLSRFGTEENRSKFIESMKAICKDLAKDYKIRFVPHVYEDIAISQSIAQDISRAEIIDFGAYAFDHSDKVVGMYQDAEFVLAMRGHGQIVPIAFNTPVIALENHPKHRGLMQTFDLLEYNVEIQSDDFQQELQSTINKLQQNYPELKEKYQHINADLQSQLDAQWQTIPKFLQ